MRLLALPLLASLVLAGCVQDAPAGVLDQQAAAPDLGTPLPSVEVLRSQVEAAAASGESVELLAFPEIDPLGFGQLGEPIAWRAVLKPSALFAPDAWAEVDGVRVALPQVAVYEGELEGRPGTPVRLTFGEGWARGTIRVNDTLHLVRVGLQGNLPAHVPDAPRPPADVRRVQGPAEGPYLYDPRGEEPGDCLLLVPPHVEPMVEPLPGPTSKDELVARIVLDADAAFVERLGPHSFAQMVAFLHEVDAIYAYEVGIRFSLVGLHLNTNATYYPDPADEAPLERLAEYWNARPDVDRDIVHLFTGQPSNYAMANCIGGAGHPEVAYTFTPLGWAEDNFVFHESAFAHELGHIFSAHHHYGNHVEGAWGRNRLNPMGQAPLTTMPQAGLATIMIQGYTPGAKPVFSTLEKSAIRGWAEAELAAR